MIDQATICVLQTISATASKNGIPVIFALLDQLDHDFNERVLEQIPQAVDISVPFDEKHTFIPKDIHPNGYANRMLADRLLRLLDDPFFAANGIA